MSVTSLADLGTLAKLRMPLDLEMVDLLIAKFKKIADEEGSDDFWSEDSCSLLH